MKFWQKRRFLHAATAVGLLLTLFSTPQLFARNLIRAKQTALKQFESAERMREALNGTPETERTRRDYQRVTDAYRRVYYTAPGSSKADASIVAVAELLAESGRRFDDPKMLRAAIGQYEFLRREYPGSKFRVNALFTIGQIYKEDLNDSAQARTTFQEFLKRYPRSGLVNEARMAIAELDRPADHRNPKPAEVGAESTRVERPERDSAASAPGKSENNPRPALVTGIRHWSTRDYTRVAIDLDAEVKYEAGRIANPDRIFFDLHDTRLSSTLVGKTFDVQDGFLRKVRVAQFQPGMTRVVLDVADVSDYSVFMLPNPYRLIIDIHGETAKNRKILLARKQAESASAASVSREKNDGREQASPTATADSKSHEKAENHPIEAAGAKSEKPAVMTATKKISDLDLPEKSSEAETKAEDAAIAAAKSSDRELNGTAKPTTEPTFQSIAPRESTSKTKSSRRKRPTEPEIVAREARPTADGERSLIRALGLKIGKIVVDAGHGGHDTGTIGPDGLQEKDLVLDVALRLGKLLQHRMGAEVVYTRDDDTFVPLETRTAIANQEQADLFISIHANSSNDPSARGVETYYLNFTSSPDALEVAARENAVSEKSIHELQDLVKKITLKEKIEESREFAADVQSALYKGVAGKNHAIRNRGVKKAPFVVLIGANMPSILAEISFLSNPTDERRLQTPEYRQKIAEYLYNGVARYVSGLSGVKVAHTREASPSAVASRSSKQAPDEVR